MFPAARLLKSMIMELLFVPNLIIYVQNERINPVYRIVNVFVFTGTRLTHFGGFWCNWMYPAATTFEINGHGAFVCSQLDELQIK